MSEKVIYFCIHFSICNLTLVCLKSDSYVVGVALCPSILSSHNPYLPIRACSSNQTVGYERDVACSIYV